MTTLDQNELLDLATNFSRENERDFGEVPPTLIAATPDGIVIYNPEELSTGDDMKQFALVAQLVAIGFVKKPWNSTNKPSAPKSSASCASTNPPSRPRRTCSRSALKTRSCSLFKIGESTLMASDGCDDKETFGGFSLSFRATDEADAKKRFNALAEGGEITMPLNKTFWSPCFGMLKDKFGVSWMVGVFPEQKPA